MKEEWFIQKISLNKFLKPRPKDKSDRAIRCTASIQCGRVYSSLMGSSQSFLAAMGSTEQCMGLSISSDLDWWSFLLIDFWEFCSVFGSTVGFDWTCSLSILMWLRYLLWTSGTWLVWNVERSCNVWPLCSLLLLDCSGSHLYSWLILWSALTLSPSSGTYLNVPNEPRPLADPSSLVIQGRRNCFPPAYSKSSNGNAYAIFVP